MDLLNEIRAFQATGMFPRQAVMEAVMLTDVMDESLAEDTSREREDIISKIKSNDFIINDYEGFAHELAQNKRSSFLTQYTPEELKRDGVITFQVKGYPIGYALKGDNGDVDIISVHNNSGIGGIGEALLDSAVKNGGTKLDHFDGFLTDFYSKRGFKEYERYKWDDQYAPSNWDYDKYGRPDVVFRRLEK